MNELVSACVSLPACLSEAAKEDTKLRFPVHRPKEAKIDWSALVVVAAADAAVAASSVAESSKYHNKPLNNSSADFVHLIKR